jgi:hypothetical protein
MGISDDIKIKAKENKPDLLDTNQPSDEGNPSEESNQVKNDTVTEIPIDRSGKTPPVYEDIFSDHEEPFEHLKKSIDTIDNKEHQQHESAPIDASQLAPVKKRKKRKWPIIVIVLVIVVVGLYFFVTKSNLFKDSSEENSNNSANQNNDSGVQIVSGQDYTRIGTDPEDDRSEESEPENTPSESETPATTTEEEPASTIDKSTILIKVLNGNGISGSAATLQKVLVDNGFSIDSVTNASNFNYETTTIYYNTGKSPQAELIKNALSAYTVTMFENPQVAGKFDVIVVVGKT